MQNNKWNKTKQFFKGKGYYIALFACLIAVGVTGLVFYNREEVPKTPANSGGEESRSSVAGDPQPADPGSLTPIRPTVPTPTKPALSDQTVDQPADPEPMTVMIPVEGDAIQCYAMDELVYNETTRDWRVHNGIDIAGPQGVEVFAAADGTVYAVYDDESLGKTVVIRHANGYSTYYSNLAEDVNVSAGDQVTAGDCIGTIGNTALTELSTDSHLHFTVTKDNKTIDPADFFGQR